MLAGQYDAIKAHIPTLTTVEQVMSIMAFVQKLDEWCRMNLWPLCEEALKRVTAKELPSDTK